MPVGEPTLEEAKRMAAGSLGLELAKTALRYAAPIYWAIRQSKSGLDDEIRNGTTFFLDCGKGAFGVTAGHVYDQIAESAERGIRCQIGRSQQPFDLRQRLIGRGQTVDIATYKISSKGIQLTGATILTGCQSKWPPAPPQVDRGIVFAGYPGVDRHLIRRGLIEFGTCHGLGIAQSVSDRDISSMIEREHVVPTLGIPLTPVGHNLGGMSGSPMLTIVQTEVVGWRLAGVIYEYASNLMEVVKAARADFIAQDGGILE